MRTKGGTSETSPFGAMLVLRTPSCVEIHVLPYLFLSFKFVIDANMLLGMILMHGRYFIIFEHF